MHLLRLFRSTLDFIKKFVYNFVIQKGGTDYAEYPLKR